MCCWEASERGLPVCAGEDGACGWRMASADYIGDLDLLHWGEMARLLGGVPDHDPTDFTSSSGRRVPSCHPPRTIHRPLNHCSWLLAIYVQFKALSRWVFRHLAQRATGIDASQFV